MKVSRILYLFFILLYLGGSPFAIARSLKCAPPKVEETKSCGLKPESLSAAVDDIAKQCEKTSADDLEAQYFIMGEMYGKVDSVNKRDLEFVLERITQRIYQRKKIFDSLTASDTELDTFDKKTLKENILGEIKSTNSEIQNLSAEKKQLQTAKASVLEIQYLNEKIKTLNEKKDLLEKTVGVYKKDPAAEKIAAKFRPKVIEHLKTSLDKLKQYQNQLKESLKSDDYKNPDLILNYLKSNGALTLEGREFKMISKGQSHPCELTSLEAYLIRSYTDSMYEDINKILRKGPAHKDYAKIKKISDVINSGLDKIASHGGLVKRGADLPPSVAQAHCLGCILKYEAFTSTSKESGFPGQHQFVIKSKSGKYVAAISEVPEEEEVLFKYGTRFKIINIVKKGGTTHYTMEEVAE